MTGFDYSALKGRTAELGKNDRDVATAAHITPATYSLKINGKSFFSQAQIILICDYLCIMYSDIPRYFFKQ